MSEYYHVIFEKFLLFILPCTRQFNKSIDFLLHDQSAFFLSVDILLITLFNDFCVSKFLRLILKCPWCSFIILCSINILILCTLFDKRYYSKQ
jgi:hypothetical protein